MTTQCYYPLAATLQLSRTFCLQELKSIIDNALLFQISFVYSSLVDGGRSVIYGGGRTREDMTRRCYSANLSMYAEKEIYRLFPVPAPKRYMYTAAWREAARKRLEQRPNAARLHFKRVSILIVKCTLYHFQTDMSTGIGLFISLSHIHSVTSPCTYILMYYNDTVLLHSLLFNSKWSNLKKKTLSA